MAITSGTVNVNSAPFVAKWVNKMGFENSPEGALLRITALEVMRASGRVSDRLKAVRALNKYRDYMNVKIQKLKELEDFIKVNGTEKDPPYMSIEEIVAKKYGLPPKPTMLGGDTEKQTKYNNALAAGKAKLIKEYGLDQRTYDLNMETGEISAKAGPGLLGKKNHVLFQDTQFISTENVSVYREKLQGEKDSASNAHQLGMTDVQAALSQKERLITQMSAMMKKIESTKMAVVRNIA